MIPPCSSPTELMALANVEPPSEAICAVLDASYAFSNPSQRSRAWWKEVSKMPWPSKKPATVAVCAGRRSLKTSGIVAWSAVYEALCVPHEQYTQQGSRLYFFVVAPVQAQAREAVRAVRAALDRLESLGVGYTARDLAGNAEIVLTAPTSPVEKVFSIVSADAVAVRGFAVPFAAIDEAGFLGSAEHLAQTDKDLLRALGPAQAQFPESRLLLTSSPGAPGTEFQRFVEKPPQGVLVVRAPTWILNPRIPRAACERIAGDAATFAIEFQASRFGFTGESFLDASRLVMGSPHSGKGARKGSFVIGLDVGLLIDDTGIVVASGFDVEISAAHAPVRHVVIEHADILPANKKDPIPVAAIAAHVAALSRAYDDAPILFDLHNAPTLKLELRKLGFREHEEKETHDGRSVTIPPRGSFSQRSMAAVHQTARWVLLRSIVNGSRLHLADGHEALARQLARLHVTTLGSGLLKVEAKKDDLADAAALAVEIAAKLPTTDGPGGAVEFRHDGVLWEPDLQSIDLANARWVRDVTLHDGTKKEVPAEVPRWSPMFEEHARSCVERGIWTAAVRDWFDALSPEQKRELQPVQPSTEIHGVNVPIRHS